MLRKVFYISDGTAITAEVFGHAVLSQFPIEFESLTIPFVETESKANEIKAQIDDCFITTGASFVRWRENNTNTHTELPS